MLSDSIVRVGLREELYLSPSQPFFNQHNPFDQEKNLTESIQMVPSLFADNMLRAKEFGSAVPFPHIVWWFFGILISSLILIVIFNVVFKGLIKNAFLQLISTDRLSPKGSKRIIQLVIFSIFSILIGLLFVIYNDYYDSVPPNDIFKVFTIISAAVLSIMLFKFAMTKIVGIITKSQAIYEILIDTTYSNLLVSSLILIAILLIISSGINIGFLNVIVIITGSLILLLYIMKLCKFFYVSLINKDGSIVNLFLYLCIVEFIPILYSIGAVKLFITNGLV